MITFHRRNLKEGFGAVKEDESSIVKAKLQIYRIILIN